MGFWINLPMSRQSLFSYILSLFFSAESTIFREAYSFDLQQPKRSRDGALTRHNILYCLTIFGNKAEVHIENNVLHGTHYVNTLGFLGTAPNNKAIADATKS
jgi:hypothetical protein